jgi:hypothetical protein
MNPPCIRCGRRGEEEHHITARDDHGEHLDEDLLVWLCKPCHKHSHNTLRILELDRSGGPLSVPERVELRLRRVAAFLVGLGPPWTLLSGPLAAALSRWADQLAGHTRGLDHHYPDWRTGLAE